MINLMRKVNKMKRLVEMVVVLMVLLTLVSCAPAADQNDRETDHNAVEEKTEPAQYIRISAEEAKAMMDSKAVIILDVRTEEEFAERRIEGAILIPDYAIKELAEEKLPDKEALILVYCRTGRRSENASRDLIDLGYTNVYDFGGIVDWDYEVFSE